MFLKIPVMNGMAHYYPIDNCHFIVRDNRVFLVDRDEEINLSIIGLEEVVLQYLDTHTLSHSQQLESPQPDN